MGMTLVLARSIVSKPIYYSGRSSKASSRTYDIGEKVCGEPGTLWTSTSRARCSSSRRPSAFAFWGVRTNDTKGRREGKLRQRRGGGCIFGGGGGGDDVESRSTRTHLRGPCRREREMRRFPSLSPIGLSLWSQSRRISRRVRRSDYIGREGGVRSVKKRERGKIVPSFHDPSANGIRQ